MTSDLNLRLRIFQDWACYRTWMDVKGAPAGWMTLLVRCRCGHVWKIIRRVGHPTTDDCSQCGRVVDV